MTRKAKQEKDAADGHTGDYSGEYSGEYKIPTTAGSPAMWWGLFAVAVAFALLAFVTPPVTENAEPRPYTVEYDFDYTAPIPPDNLVYENENLAFGQPIFLSVVDDIETSVVYKINNPNVRVDNGELVLKVILFGSAGWQRELARSEPVTFTGTEASASIPIDFRAAIDTGAAVDAEIDSRSTLTVRLVAETYVNGELLQNGKGPGGLDERTFANIGFSLTDTTASVVMPSKSQPNSPSNPAAGTAPGTAAASSESGYASSELGYTSSELGYTSSESGYLSTESGYLSSESGYAFSDEAYASTESGYLATDAYANASPGSASTSPGSASTSPGSANASPGSANSLGNSSGTGSPSAPSSQDASVKTITQMVPTDIMVPNKLSLGFVEVPVEAARTFVVVLVGLFLLGGIFSTFLMASIRRKGPLDVLIAKHHKRIIPMSAISTSDVKDAVTVPTFDALMAVSLETEQLVMMKRYGSSADFFVSDNGSTYHYFMDASPVQGDGYDDERDDEHDSADPDDSDNKGMDDSDDSSLLDADSVTGYGEHPSGDGGDTRG